MDRVLCVIFCLAVIAVSLYALGCFDASAEPSIEVTEPSSITEPPVTEAEPPTTEATVPETKPTVATEPTETEPPTILYDVPLSEDLQMYIIGLGERFGIDPAIIIAQIWKESRFNPNSVGDGGDSLGLMQIQPKWHSGWMKLLNCPDLLDPYQNVYVGVHILADHYQRYDDIGMALTSYNAGATGAYNNYFSKGIYASEYAESVMAYADDIR